MGMTRGEITDVFILVYLWWRRLSMKKSWKSFISFLICFSMISAYLPAYIRADEKESSSEEGSAGSVFSEESSGELELDRFSLDKSEDLDIDRLSIDPSSEVDVDRFSTDSSKEEDVDRLSADPTDNNNNGEKTIQNDEIETDVESVSQAGLNLTNISANGTLKIVEKTCGYEKYYYDGDDEITYFYYYVKDALYSSSVTFTIKYSDGETYTGTLSNIEDKLCEDGLDGYSMVLDSQAADSPWIVGNTYTATVKFGSISCSVNVEIIPEPIESITCNGTLKIVEETYGYISDGWDENDNLIEYFQYSVREALENSKLTFTLTYNNGTSDLIATYNELRNQVGGSFSIIDGQDWDNQWTVGNTYPIKAYFHGKECVINVKIIPDPVESITCSGKLQIVTGTYTYWEYGWTEDDEYYEYLAYNVSEALADSDLSFTVSYNDGTSSVTGNYSELADLTGCIVDVTTTQSYSAKWEKEHTYTATVSCGKKSCEIEVEILPLPIKSITCNGTLHIREGSNGYYTTDTNNQSYFIYSIRDAIFDSDLTFTISYNDGRAPITGALDELEELTESYIDITTSQNNVHWLPGNTYQAKITYEYVEGTMDITIDESSVSSITCNADLRIMENTNGYMSTYWDDYDEPHEYYVYSVGNAADNAGIVYTIRYKDGSSISGTRYEIQDQTGEYIEFNYFQSGESPWTSGNTYSANIYFQGRQGTLNVIIYKNPVVSVTFNGTLHIPERTYGYDGEIFYYDVRDALEDSDLTFTITYNEGTSPITLKYSEFYEKTGYSLAISDEQSVENPWLPGGTYAVEYSFTGVKGTMSVVIDPSPVKSFTVSGPLHIVENTYGYLNTYNTDPYFDYYVSSALYASDIVFTITYNDGRPAVTGTYEQLNEKGLSFNINYSQYSNNPWTAGHTYQAKVTCEGKVLELSVVIDPTPVKSIDVSGPVHVVENTCGYLAYSYTGSTYFVYHVDGVLNNSDVIFTITYNDGRPKVSGTASQLRDKGIELSVSADQSSNDPWTVGNTYQATIFLEGKSEDINVIIDPTPVKNISVSGPLHILENTHGYITERWSDGVRYYCYNVTDTVASSDIIITITYNDGRDTVSGTYSQLKNQGIDLSVSAEQNVDDPWTAGHTYPATLYSEGKETGFDIIIDPSPVQSITMNKDLHIIENTYGGFSTYNDIPYYSYYISNAVNYSDMIFTITYNDGRPSVSGTYSQLGNQQVYLSFDSNQGYSNQWTTGQTYQAQVILEGKRVDFNVVIDSTPVKSISVNGPLHILENSNGSFNTNNGISYFYYSVGDALSSSDIVFTITYNDGRPAVSGTYHDLNNQGVLFSVINDQNFSDPWTAGHTYQATIYCDGKAYDLSVVIDRTPVKSISSSGPLHIIENTKGYISKNADGFSYYSYGVYDALRSSDIIFTITYNDGRPSVSGTYSQLIDQKIPITLNYSQNSNNPWTVGNTYQVQIISEGKQYSLNVIIDPTPVKNITVSGPLHIIENSFGYMSNYTGEYFYYYVDEALESSDIEFTITYNDGRPSVTGTYSQLDNQDISINLITDQSASTPWTVGNTYQTQGYMEGKPFSLNVVIDDSPIQSITFSGPLHITEYTNGSFDTTESSTYYVYHVGDALQNSNIVFTINYNDGRPAVSGPYAHLKSLGYKLSVSAYQDSYTPWTAGHTYQVPVFYEGKKVDLNVVIDPSPVSSFTVSGTMHVVQGTCGGVYEDDDGSYYYYYLDNALSYSDIVFTIAYNDGRPSVTGTYAELTNKGIYFTSRSQQSGAAPWTPGSTYQAQVYCEGKPLTLNVVIDATPYKSIKCNKTMHITENTYGYFSDNNVFQYSFYTNEVPDDVTFTITYNDNRTPFTGTVSEIYEETGIQIRISELHGPVTPGNTYPVSIYFAGIEGTMNLAIDPTPVKSVSCSGILTIQENTCGYLTTWDTNPWYEYDVDSALRASDLVFNVTYKDNSAGFTGSFEELAEYLPSQSLNIYDYSQYQKHWVKGTTAYAYIYILGYKLTLEVQIIGNDVKSFSSSTGDCYVLENTNGYLDSSDDPYYRYSIEQWEYIDGQGYAYLFLDPDMLFTITYNDGRPDLTGTAKEIFLATGQRIEFSEITTQSQGTPWVAGGVYVIRARFNGKECRINVHITEQATISDPTDVKASFTGKNDYVDVTWSFDGVAEGFYVYRTCGNSRELIATIAKGGVRTYRDNTISYGKSYTYGIVAYRQGLSELLLSSEVSATVSVPQIAPSKVTGLKAAAAGKYKVKLTWNAVSGAEGYLIYGQKNGKYGYVGMTTKGTTYTDTKAISDDYNFYWVFAYIKNSSGKMIAGGCEKYVYAKGVCPAATGLKASSVKGGVKLTWDKVQDAEGYLIYGIVDGKPYGYVGMTTSGTTYTDKKASATQYNYYWVFPYFKDSNGKMIVGQTAKYTYGRALK